MKKSLVPPAGTPSLKLLKRQASISQTSGYSPFLLARLTFGPSVSRIESILSSARLVPPARAAGDNRQKANNRSARTMANRRNYRGDDTHSGNYVGAILPRRDQFSERIVLFFLGFGRWQVWTVDLVYNDHPHSCVHYSASDHLQYRWSDITWPAEESTGSEHK